MSKAGNIITFMPIDTGYMRDGESVRIVIEKDRSTLLFRPSIWNYEIKPVPCGVFASLSDAIWTTEQTLQSMLKSDTALGLIQIDGLDIRSSDNQRSIW